MAHATAGWCSNAGNETDNWLGIGARVVLLQVVGGGFFCLATDFANQQDAFGLGIGKENLRT